MKRNVIMMFSGLLLSVPEDLRNHEECFCYMENFKESEWCLQDR